MFRTPRSLNVQPIRDPTGEATRLSGVGRLRIWSTVKVGGAGRAGGAGWPGEAGTPGRKSSATNNATAGRVIVPSLLRGAPPHTPARSLAGPLRPPPLPRRRAVRAYDRINARTWSRFSSIIP